MFMTIGPRHATGSSRSKSTSDRLCTAAGLGLHSSYSLRPHGGGLRGAGESAGPLEDIRAIVFPAALGQQDR